jgi:UDP-N-acetyl-D-galactosamine dehydrogenase
MTHKRMISVIGLGYVGLPVAVAFARQHRVVGFDINSRRISDLKNGIDGTREVSSTDLESANILFSSDLNDLKQADFHIVAVPTPINHAKQPDLSPVLSASRTLGKVLKKNDIVVYESTVYPGATEEECIPILESLSGLTAGRDFFVGYSPERINPGDKEHTFTRIRKVVSAQTTESLEIVAEVYGSVVTAGVHKAPSIKVAEAAKVIENTQRDLNISLMNELALIFERLGIDTGDVLEAAGTKWNFLPFRPGLVGGHCIGVDPYYLTYKAEVSGYSPQVILAGRRINDGMGLFVASQVVKAMIKKGYGVQGQTVHILGFTFKENVPDTRNTRVIDIVRALEEYDLVIQIHDPEADRDEARHEYGIEIVDDARIEPGHAVIMAVAHNEYKMRGWDYISGLLVDGKGVVFDVTRMLDRSSLPAGIELIRL